MLSSEIFVKRERERERERERRSFEKPRENAAEAILKTYELFIYGDNHYITNSFCKKVL
jgi:hypothetical protein